MRVSSAWKAAALVSKERSLESAWSSRCLAKVTFDQVLLTADGDKVQAGQPMVKGAKVVGHIVEHGRGPKIVIFKFKRRKNYRRKQGHRQRYTQVRIESIEA